MKLRRVLQFLCLLLTYATVTTGCSRAQEYPQITVPAPSRHDIHAGGDQQLTFTVMKNSVKLKGLQVYLDPTSTQDLKPESKSYLGSVYFSDEAAGKERDRSTFVLPLKQPVTGASHLLLVPLDSAGATRGGLAIVRARIAAPDNSAFK